MTTIWTPTTTYHRTPYSSEADLESAILDVQSDPFGPNCIYPNIQRSIL
jgi:hypothetical protein